MKLKQEFIKLDKPFVYDQYIRIIYDYKDYDDITRAKMLDEVIKYYNEDYRSMLEICTMKELHFLKKFINKDLTIEDIQKYKWEIQELNNKYIFSNVTYEVFEEVKDIVIKALNNISVQELNKRDEVIIPLVAFVKSYVDTTDMVLMSFGELYYDAEKEKIKQLFYTPLFRYYCYYTKKYFESMDSDIPILIYRDYYNFMDLVDESRKQFGVPVAHPFTLKELSNIFYYDYDIDNPKIKKMYNIVDKQENFMLKMMVDDIKLYNSSRDYLYQYIEENYDDAYIKIFDEALDNIPCAAMNAITPLEYEKHLDMEEELDDQIISVKQEDACLSKTKAKLYYKLFFALLEFTNNKYKVNEKVRKIYGQHGMNGASLMDINEKLWSEKETLIDEFVTKNPYHFNKKELTMIQEFKRAITKDFIMYSYEKEYTALLDDTGKCYMIKGINCNIDEIIDKNDLPQMIKTTLIPFDDTIVYCSLFSSYPLQFDLSFKRMAIEEYEKAIKYYHL